MRISGPIAVLVLAMQASAQPRFVSETPLGLPAARYETDGRNEHPVAIGTGTGFLVVWESKRATEPAQLYVSRLDLAGVRIEPTGALLSPSSRGQYAPAAARGLTSTLVVWEDAEPTSSDLLAVRVRDDGTVLDVTPLALTVDATSQTQPAVAFDGTEWWVVFTQRAGAESDLRAVRVNEATGAVSSAFDLVTAPLDQTNASVSFDGARWHVAYVEGAGNGNVFMQRFQPTGVPSEARLTVEVSSRPSVTPTVAAIAGRWTVAYQEDSAPTQVHVIRGADAMTGSGSSFPSTNDQCSPHAFVNGAELEVVFHQSFAGFRRQLVPASTPLPVATFANSGINGNAQLAAAASDGGVLAVIVVPPSSGEDSYLRGARFGGLDSLPISEGSAAVRDVRLLADGEAAWAVYGERVRVYDTWSQVGVQRVDATGTTTDAGVLVTWDIGQQLPSVSSNGSTTLVAWPTWTGVFVTPWDGSLNPQLMPGTSVTTASVQSLGVALAANDDGGFLLAWADDRAAMFESDFYFTRLDATGAVLDVGGRALRVAMGGTRFVSVGFDGLHWLAATVDDLGRLELARIDAAGTVGEVRALGEALDAPTIATGPGEALVVWSAPTDAGAQLVALRSFPDAGWSGGAVTSSTASHRRPHARWAGTRYVVAFDSNETDQQQVLLGELEARSGAALVVSPAATWSSPSDVFATDLAVLTTGDVLVAGTHFASQGAALNSRRGFVARFTMPVDAGVMDAGVTSDAGMTDAGVAPTDGGTEPSDGGTGPRRVLPVSCGCSSVEALGALALAFLIRRRRVI